MFLFSQIGAMAEQAPVYNLELPSFIGIEFPLKVNNTERAVALIAGGEATLAKCFIEQDTRLELRLRPQDPYSHPLRSTTIHSNENVLLKFRVPKRVLHKFHGNIQQCLAYCDSHGITYHTETVGMLRQNFKFRQLADFQVLTHRNEFLNEFSHSVRVGDLNKIKQFSSKLEKSLHAHHFFTNDSMDVPPLPRYARTDISHGYKYFGNLLLNEQGEWLNKSVRLHTIQIKWKEPIPTQHDPRLTPQLENAQQEIELMKLNNLPQKSIDESPSCNLVKCIQILDILFDMKPIWIRKHINAILPENLRGVLRFALPFVSYTFVKGPWRHSFVRIGYDPRKDPNASMFQIEAFRSANTKMLDDDLIGPDEPIKKKGRHNEDDNEEEDDEEEEDEDVNQEDKKLIITDDANLIIPPTLFHKRERFEELKQLGVSKIPRALLFDGKSFSNCLSFQMGDILDEDIKHVLANAELEKTCHIGPGWFHWVTIARVKTIVKYKLTCTRDNVHIDREKVEELMKKETFQKSVIQGMIVSSEEEDDEEEEEEEQEDQNMDIYPTQKRQKSDKQAPAGQTGPLDIIQRLEQFNPNGANVIQDLDSILKQENLMNV